MGFKFEKLEIKDVILVKPDVFGDNRGFFMETYKKSEFVKNGITDDFNQDNFSSSSKGVLRGLHYQEYPYCQAKLVRCQKGKIYDVVVDIRRDSETFGKYLRVELSDENKYQLYVPKGFAHGFVVLSDMAEIIYKVSGEYKPESEGGIMWNDSEIGIDWGIEDRPIISAKDEKRISFSQYKKSGVLVK